MTDRRGSIMSKFVNLYEFTTINPVGLPCLHCGVVVTEDDDRVTVAVGAYDRAAAHRACSERAGEPRVCSRVGCVRTNDLTQHRRDGESGVTDRWAFCPEHEAA
jgi:hypothetical protein